MITVRFCRFEIAIGPPLIGSDYAVATRMGEKLWCVEVRKSCGDSVCAALFVEDAAHSEASMGTLRFAAGNEPACGWEGLRKAMAVIVKQKREMELL